MTCPDNYKDQGLGASTERNPGQDLGKPQQIDEGMKTSQGFLTFLASAVARTLVVAFAQGREQPYIECRVSPSAACQKTGQCTIMNR